MMVQLNAHPILPAIRDLKDFDKILESQHHYFALLDMHLSQLKPIVRAAKKYDKKVLLHADLVHGLRSDESAAEFLCQDIQPYGLISTRGTMLSVAKKKGLLTIQRIFMLDSLSLQTSYRTLEKVKPDIIELLPGIIPSMIKEVRKETNVPVIAGGLIRTKQDVKQAIDAGASAVSTTRFDLWESSFS